MRDVPAAVRHDAQPAVRSSAQRERWSVARLRAWIDTERPGRAFAIAAVGILVAGYVDYATGTELRTYPLYFGPISYGAWRLSRRLTLTLSALSALSWVTSNMLAGRNYTSDAIWVANTVTQLIAFGLVGFLIAELRRRLTIEQALARHDPLTGLWNTRAFHERADLLLSLSRRGGRPLVLAYLDLDNFKLVNDQHGHDTGDRALHAVARVLRDGLRASDLVARVGGDEFAVLLPETEGEAARTTLERLRRQVREAMQAQAWPITVSVGAMCYARPPSSLQDALTTTDGLMYRAKRSGKDRLHMEQETTSPSAVPNVGDAAD